MTTLATMGHPPDFHSALSAQSVDAPYKLVASQVSLSDKNVRPRKPVSHKSGRQLHFPSIYDKITDRWAFLSQRAGWSDETNHHT
jgi:hypothetical protein